MSWRETYRHAVEQQGFWRVWLNIITSPWRLLGFWLERLGLWMQGAA